MVIGHHLSHLRITILRQIQLVQYLIIPPDMAQEISHTTARGIHMTERWVQYLCCFLGNILTLAQLAVNKILWNILF